MDKRLALFFSLSLAILVAHSLFLSWLSPPKVARKNQPPAKQALAQPGPEAAQKPPAEPKTAANEPKEKPSDEPAAEEGPKEEVLPQWIALGSADPASPYRMLVTLTNKGAAVEALELNSPRYRDLDDRSGYLGYLSAGTAPRGGAFVHVVGAGTPAAAAGMQADDVITAVNGKKISSAAGLDDALEQTEPKQTVHLTVMRKGVEQQLSATLERKPLAVIRPEKDSKPIDIVEPKEDPLSLLLTMRKVDDQELSEDAHELKGIDMLGGNWELASHDQTEARFRKRFGQYGLEVFKTFTLRKVPPQETKNPDYPAYDLDYKVEVHNTGRQTRTVAYRQQGPTGLPIEGAWYANKVSRTWSGSGLRDVVAKFNGRAMAQVSCYQIVDNKAPAWRSTPLDYVGVDVQYFAAALIPRKATPDALWFDEVQAIRVGAVPENPARKNRTDVSFRLDSVAQEVEPDGTLSHEFMLFAGPKRPSLLVQYGPPGATLDDLVYYGWFGFVAVPMLQILHGFYYVVRNYGLAIIMLTVLVRGGMFPLSRKQALSAQKMQELQPEIKRINEKYKGNVEQRTKAQQELFRKHNYNPLGGCLLVFLQLPIFVGLYRSLAVDIELRDAPLFGEAIRWASNLAGPDMFWNWSAVMPEFVTQGTGFFGLGPYLNLFPLATVALFIWNQKITMPPPADEQAALQQKMMQYMSIFIGLLMYKVASGLCLYFIASSIWGITERKLLPKAAVPGHNAGAGGAKAGSEGGVGNGSPRGKKKQRERN